MTTIPSFLDVHHSVVRSHHYSQGREMQKIDDISARSEGSKGRNDDIVIEKSAFRPTRAI